MFNRAPKSGVGKTIVTLVLILVFATATVGAVFYSSLLTDSIDPPENSPTPSPPVTPTPSAVPASDPINQSDTPSLFRDSSSFRVPFNVIGDWTVQKGTFETTANATLGNWSAQVAYTPLSWTPGETVNIESTLSLSEELFTSFKTAYFSPTSVCILLTAERDFDPAGYQHIPWAEQVSTLLTPSGLPIEGGGSAAISRYTGYAQRTPVDLMIDVPIASFSSPGETLWRSGQFTASFVLPEDLPPGIYRLRVDFGFQSGTKRLSFNGDGIGVRPKDLKSVSCVYSPPVPASGADATGKPVDASQIQRRSYWVLLWDYNSNGYRGVVAKEDQKRVAISPRHIIHDEVILPRFDTKGNALSYNIEPTFLLDNVNSQRNIPWRYDRGEWSVKVTLPNGTTKDLGASKFIAKRGNGATTKNATFTSWKPPVYGNYSIEASGWIEDIWGNRYEGGGQYSFWIAERMTLATATFQGQPYNVGNRYGRDLAFAPAVPAEVTIKASLYANSDPNNVTTVMSTGRASQGGIFTTTQGMKTLQLNAPGEYFATILATYWDPQGNLWVCAMTHAGVVYPIDSTIEAHGKKLSVQGKLVDRGERHFEGFIAENGTSYLDHINFPYNGGDCLLIASEHQTSNKIEPVLTYKFKNSNASYDSALQTIGKSNVRIRTSNNLSPEMFPEYITDMEYFYASAPRPGFNSRFIVAHDNTRAPYWPTSPNTFGGQIGSSSNGDLPGDIYRLLGGVVLRPTGQTPMYAGYQASAFILPKGSNNNRVIGPGDEDLPSPDGVSSRFFLVSVRPGMVYEVGTSFRAVLQIDPVLPCNVRFNLTGPDRLTRVTEGSGDQYGYFAAKDSWILSQPGVWTYTVEAAWNGYKGRVPGLPETGGWIFVIENGTAPGPGLTLNLSREQSFSPLTGLNVTGRSYASEVYFTAIIPGAVLEQGIVSVANGEFKYNFDPDRLADKILTYDIVNLINGKPEIGRVVHLTFFSKESGPEGEYHSFVRVILRGTLAIYIKDR